MLSWQDSFFLDISISLPELCTKFGQMDHTVSFQMATADELQCWFASSGFVLKIQAPRIECDQGVRLLLIYFNMFEGYLFHTQNRTF